MTAPPTVAYRDPVLAGQLDTLLLACEDRLALLYPGARSWLLFNTSGLPQQQIPPMGAVYVLSEDADRRLIPPPGTAGNPDGGGPWPKKYNHAAFSSAVAAMPTVGLGPGSTAWLVDPTGTLPIDVYTVNESLAVFGRTATDPVQGTLTLPVWFQTAVEPERFYRYALADVLVESASPRTYAFPYDKFGVIRFHNLGTVNATFDLGDGIPVVVPPDGIVTIRRTSRTGVWSSAVANLRRYFPGCLPGDVPVWDGLPAAGALRPVRAHAANPIFRVAFLQSMFRPQALTEGPGLFSGKVEDVLPLVAKTEKLAKALVQEGTFDVVRSPPNVDIQDAISVHTLSYSGQDLAETPEEWAQIGLLSSIDPAHRGARLTADPAFPGPGSGFVPWHYDFILGSSNLIGAVVARQGIVLPWFRVGDDDSASDAAADAWAQSLFAWPTYAVTREVVQAFHKLGHWKPLVPVTGSLNPDYCGSWVEDDIIETRQFTADWTAVAASSLGPWNVFTSQISDLLPSGSGKSEVELRRHPVFLAVVLQQTVDWHAPRQDATWDDATAVRPRPPAPGRPEGGPGFKIGGRPLGLGAPDEDQWTEPLFQAALLPTLGHDAQGSWYALGMYGAEPVAWGPLVPFPGGTGTLCHWRLDGHTGNAAGADWTWNYSGSSNHPPVGNEPSGEIVSGMSAWRVFAQIVRQAGGSQTYPAKAQIGPQPWAIRDHAWLAREVLAGTVVAAGEDWRGARQECYDLVPISGPPGSTRPDEFRVGFQIRMTAATLNGISALVRGMTHCRPLSWSEYARGFNLDELYEPDLGWSVGIPEVILQPYGAAWIYGTFTAIDAKLDALGITRRGSGSATLQALRSFAATEWTPQGGIRPGSVPSSWLTAGDEIQWCSHEDIHAAMAARGFAFDHVRFVQPVLVTGYGPAEAPQAVAESFILTGDVQMSPGGVFAPASLFAPPVLGWQRIAGTFPLIQPEPAEAPEVQMVFIGHKARIARPNPVIRAQVHFPRTSLGAGSTRYDVTTIGPMTGQEADSIDRFFGGSAFQGGLRPADQPLGSILWSARLIGRAGAFVDVIATPLRFLIPESRTEDRTGPRTLQGQEEFNVPFTLPPDNARSKALRIATGMAIAADSLETGDWPDHLVWQLDANRPDLRQIP